MELGKMELEKISKEYGDAFYLLDTDRLKNNYVELDTEFRNIYPKFKISYSYKTNYVPEVCRVIDDLGGYAEVVSDMECEIAERIGVEKGHIILNGPCKKKSTMEKLLLNNGIVNVENMRDFLIIKEIAAEHPDCRLGIGIRCNFEIGDGVVSRFGFDVVGDDFKNLLLEIEDTKNIWIRGLHCHFASRDLEYWPKRAEKIVEIAKKHLACIPEYISLGGGIFGKMPESLKKQFVSDIPLYSDYARETATVFQREYGKYPEGERPLLFIEPGSALAGDIMEFACRVLNMKEVGGKKIATVLGSMYNINPTLNKKNPPLKVVPMGQYEPAMQTACDIAGYTCIESDYLYRGYEGELAEGDFLIFGNAGSYSVVLKPPFILPNFPIIKYQEESIEEIKRAENFDDIFHTYKF